MFEKILRNIWDGGKGLDLTMCHSERYQQLLDMISECDDELSEFLNEDGKEILEEFHNLSISLCAECEYQAFEVGYKFGVRMIVYALRD